MDKNTFISELKQALSVLEEGEQRDIVGEYEQHIDMKVKNGLTEEEAIADFGDLKELAAEILEAYHVRADYAADKNPKNEERAGLRRKTAGLLEKGEEKAGSVWRRLRAFSKRQADQVRGILERAKGDETAASDEKEGVSGGAFRRFLAATGLDRLWAFCVRMVRRAVRLCGAILSWCRSSLVWLAQNSGSLVNWAFHWGWRLLRFAARSCWNVGWMLFALLAGGMGLFSLFGFGVLAVLWLQGYPLLGVTVGVFGINLCLFSAAFFGLTLRIKKAGRASEKPENRICGEEESSHA